MNELTKQICDICRQKQKERNHAVVNCAFLHDNCYCDRIEDIDALIKKLLKMESKERKIFPDITLPEGSAEFVDKVIADAERFLKENK